MAQVQGDAGQESASRQSLPMPPERTRRSRLPRRYLDPMSSEPQTQYERPVKEVALAELKPLLAKQIHLYGNHLLLLPEPERIGAVCAEVLESAAERGRAVIEVSAPGGPREALQQIAAAVLAHYGVELELRREDPDYLGVHSAFIRGLGQTGRQRRQVEALLLIRDLEPQAAVDMFARGRDEAWEWDVQTVVVAPKEDKDNYLLTYSDPYFLHCVYYVV